MNGLQSHSQDKPDSPTADNGNGRGLLGWLFRRPESGRPARTVRVRAKGAAGNGTANGEIAMPANDGRASGRRLAKAKSVLIISADDLTSRLWRREIEEWGYAVQFCPDAESGLDKLFDIGYDAVLLDIAAPNIAGLTALEEIRSEEAFKNLFIGVFVRDRGAGAEQETAAVSAGANRAFRRDETNAEAILTALKTALFPRVMKVEPRSRQIRPATGGSGLATLPVNAAPAAPAPEPTSPAPRPTLSMAGPARAEGEEIKGPAPAALKKVLIIEDDENIASAYRTQLEASGFEVEVALDGATGFHDLHTIAPNALLVDLFLPGISGLDIVKKTRIQKRFEKLPILVFSSAYSREVEAEAREAGATHFFDKSTARPGDVIRALNELFFPGRNQTAAAAATPTPAAPPLAMSPEVQDDALKNEIRGALLLDTPELVKALRQSLGGFLRAQGGGDLEGRAKQLLELHRRIHSLVGNAAIAGFSKVARLASALDALLREFQDRPDSINPSTQRTLTQAVDFLVQLFAREGAGEEGGTMGSEQILVVDDEVISRRVLGHSLEKARLKPTAVEHPQAALELLGTKTFDLIFLDVEMPGMNGFELCKKLRELPRHAKTPVIFVTALSGFDSRVKSSLSGGDDFIGKPFSYIELAVKALVYVLRGRSPAAAAPTGVK